MTGCHHPITEKVVDRLGLMRERDGVLGAPILAWHFDCLTCGSTLSQHSAPDPDLDWYLDPYKVQVAADKIGEAITAVRAFRTGGH